MRSSIGGSIAIVSVILCQREAGKNCRAIKRGGGVKGPAIKEKIPFFILLNATLCCR